MNTFVLVKVKVKSLSCVWLFATPWTAAYQAPLSMGFSKQECWSGLPFPSAGDLPDPGIEPGSPTLQEDALPSEPPGKPVLVCIGTCTIFVIISYLPFMCQKKNNKKTCRESKEVQNIVLLLWIFFFFLREYLFMCPGCWPLNLNIQHRALTLSHEGGSRHGPGARV